MKKSTYLFSTVLLLFFYLQACQQPASQKQTNTQDTAKAIDLSAPDIDKVFKALCEDYTPDIRRHRKDTGMEVSYDCAQLCFTAYGDTIKEGGYLSTREHVHNENQSSRPRPRIKRYRLVTNAEFFSGTDLVCWLYQQHALAEMNEDTLDTKIELGVYTRQFFDCLARGGNTIPDTIRDKKIGRISMFVVVRKKGTEKLAGDPKVYDFGGLQP